MNEPAENRPGDVRVAAPATTPSGLSRLVTRVAGWATGVFFTVERAGPPLPPGPVLVVANHPNALVDPLVIFRTAGRVTRPLAKAPLFDYPVLGSILRAMGGLPVYRRQDDPALMDRNEGTFDAAVRALQAGEAVQIYPEGKTHSEPGLSTIRTGAARIALRAESESGWELGLQVVPVGLTYVRKSLAGGSVVAHVGHGFGAAGLREAHERDPQEAVRTLTNRIADALEGLTLNFAEHEDRELVEVAERMYARQKGLVGWRERDSLANRLPRLKDFARGLAWLRAYDPERHDRVTHAVRRYARLLAVLGAGDADVPRRYDARSVALYLMTQGLALALSLPFAAVGTVMWWVPYSVPRLVVGFTVPSYESLSTVKLATAIVAFPVFGGLYAAAGWWLGGLWWALAVGLAAPVCGLVAWAWKSRWDRVREDVRLYFRVLGRRESRDRLASERARLVQEFDELSELLAADRSG